MDDKNGALEKLKAAMDEAERVDMSSVKIGDIIYVPLDEEDGLILKTDMMTAKIHCHYRVHARRSGHRCVAHKFGNRFFQEKV